MRFKLFLTTTSWLCLLAPVAAQPIDMAPICAAYADRPLFTRNSQPVSLTCAQLTAWSSKFQLKQSMASAVMPKIASLGSLNLDDFLDGAPGNRGCSRSTLPSGLYAMHCTLTLDGVSLVLDAFADKDGYLTELTAFIPDFRELLATRPKVFEADDLTDDLYQLVIDTMIAKDATFAAPGATMERVGPGAPLQIPQPSAP